LNPDGDHFPANTLKIFTECIGWNRDHEKRKRVTHFSAKFVCVATGSNSSDGTVTSARFEQAFSPAAPPRPEGLQEQ
jgi:hypothetical protein